MKMGGVLNRRNVKYVSIIILIFKLILVHFKLVICIRANLQSRRLLETFLNIVTTWYMLLFSALLSVGFTVVCDDWVENLLKELIIEINRFNT